MSKELVDKQLYYHLVESLKKTDAEPQLYSLEVIFQQMIESLDDKTGMLRFTETYSSLFPNNITMQTVITILEQMLRSAKKEKRFLTNEEIEIIARAITSAIPPSAFKSLH